MTTPGPWIDGAAVTAEQEVIDNFYGSGEYYSPVTSYPWAGGSWASAAEGAEGVGDSFWPHPPKRSSYALYSQAGQLGYGSGDYATEDVTPPDGYALELDPFNLDLYTKITNLLLPAPTLPSGAIGWEYEDYPVDTYGTRYRPHAYPELVTSAKVRALLEVNRTSVATDTVVQTADPTMTWITPPVAGVAGPQRVVFRYDGPGFAVSTGYAHLALGWSGAGGEDTSVLAASGVDGVYAVFDFIIELGPDEYLSQVTAGYINETTNAVHWQVVYSDEFSDYLRSEVAGGDMPLFLPQPLTLQMRLLPIDGGSKWRSGATLASYPLLWEHTTAGVLNEDVDTGWVDVGDDLTFSGLYVHYAEQVSHALPHPAVLPARRPRHYHLNSGYGYTDGQPQRFGSTVGFERPEAGGTYQRLQLRIAYTPPRHRFLFVEVDPEMPTPSSGGGGSAWVVGGVAWGTTPAPPVGLGPVRNLNATIAVDPTEPAWRDWGWDVPATGVEELIGYSSEFWTATYDGGDPNDPDSYTAVELIGVFTGQPEDFAAITPHNLATSIAGHTGEGTYQDSITIGGAYDPNEAYLVRVWPKQPGTPHGPDSWAVTRVSFTGPSEGPPMTETGSAGGATMSVTGPSTVVLGVGFDIHVVASGLHVGDDGTVPSLAILFSVSGYDYDVTDNAGTLGASSYGPGTFVSTDGTLDLTFHVVAIPVESGPGSYPYNFDAFSPGYANIHLVHEPTAG